MVDNEDGGQTLAGERLAETGERLQMGTAEVARTVLASAEHGGGTRVLVHEVGGWGPDGDCYRIEYRESDGGRVYPHTYESGSLSEMVERFAEMSGVTVGEVWLAVEDVMVAAGLACYVPVGVLPLGHPWAGAR